MVQVIIDKHFIEVAIPTLLDQTFTYEAETLIRAGQRIIVPFGLNNRPMMGVCLGDARQENSVSFTVKKVLEVVDEEPIYSANMLELARWLSEYYLYPLGEVLRTMLPAGGTAVKKRVGLWQQKSSSEWSETLPEGVLDSLSDFLRFLFGKKERLGEASINRKLRLWDQEEGRQPADVLWGLCLKHKICCWEEQRQIQARKSQWIDDRDFVPTPEGAKSLTPAQQQVFDRLIEKGMNAPPETRKPFLLWGITGAGKTEIYLQLIENMQKNDPAAQTLIMVPEISLTPQMTQIFQGRFPGKVAVVHSAMTETSRWSQLELIRFGQRQILIGPRSAVFAPFKRLKLIIVDEEHDQSYKQATGLCYHGRDVAVLRGKFDQAMVLLGSATPCLESFWNGQSGKYTLLTLNERVGGRSLPTVEIVPQKLKRRSGQRLPQKAEDFLADVPISDRILSALESTLKKNEQAMVIVNRRGFAYYLFSIDRQEPIKCPHCSVSLTVHKSSRRLRCHYCDYQISLHEIQKERQNETLVTVGYGSEQAEDYLRQVLPDARIVRVDSDTVQKKDVLANVLRDFRDGKIDILVGTQILAKGHDFAKVTLICLLEIDQSLSLPDFRAGERTFQLIVQASGRAGRSGLPGHVLVQCLKPDHPVVLAAMRQDFLEFSKLEIDFRQVNHYPPFTRLILFELNGPSIERLECATKDLKQLIDRFFAEDKDRQKGMMILGPAVPPIELIRKRFRRTLIIGGRNFASMRLLANFLRKNLERLPKEIRFKIDIDPQSIL